MPGNAKAEYISVSPTCKACLSKQEFIDSEKGEITLGDIEYRTLNYIIEKDGVPASRDEILKEVKYSTNKEEYDRISLDDKLPTYNSVDKTVSEIRKKIHKVYVKTVRNVGYKWAPPKEAKIQSGMERIREAKKTKGPDVIRPNLIKFMTPEEAASKVKSCLAEFEQSEDEDESTKIIQIIERVMIRLTDEAYADLEDYFKSYEEYLQETGQTETVKEWLCSMMLLKFLRNEYMKRLSEYEERLQSTRNEDLKDKMQKTILDMKDYLLVNDMHTEEYRGMIRERAQDRGRLM